MMLLLMTFNVCYAEEITQFSLGNSLGGCYDISEQTGGLKIEIADASQNTTELMFCNLEEDKTVEEYLEEQIKKHTNEIYLANYNIRITDLMQLLNGRYDFMIATGHIVYDPIDQTVALEEQIVENFYPIYFFDETQKEKEQEAIKFVEDCVQSYVEYVTNITDEPVEQLLLVHDMLIANCDYDYTCVDAVKTNDNEVSFSVLGVFANNTAVCQGYADAFYLIAKALGINVGFCNSLKKAHIWNYVELDGIYYHIDATWDEPELEKTKNEDGTISVSGLRTTAMHSNFLVSDAGFANHGVRQDWYSSYEKTPVCNSSKYESNHFFNMNFEFTTLYNDGYYYACWEINDNFKIYFRNKKMYAGKIVPSVVYTTSDSLIVYWYQLENDDKIDIIMGSYLNNKPDRVMTKTFEKNFVEDVLEGVQIPNSQIPDGMSTVMYLWDLEDLIPLSEKVILN